jgi:hypothetical protein
MTTVTIPPSDANESNDPPRYYVRPGAVVTFELADPTLTATVDFDPSRCCFSSSDPLTLNSGNPTGSRTVSENATGDYPFNMTFSGGRGKESKVGDLDVTTDPPPPPRKNNKR